MKVLVTGATGWVGSWLIPRLLSQGHQVGGTRGGSALSHESRLTAEESSRVDWRPLDLTNALSVENAVEGDWDAVVHLAGVSRHVVAELDPGDAWNVNAAGTARLCHALASKSESSRPAVLVISSSDVYGEGASRQNVETDHPMPLSTYGATKLGAELAARGVAAATGLKVMVARPWPHTGLGQRLLLFPRWISTLKRAKAEGRTADLKGDPDIVRDYLSVGDVVEAYVSLLEAGVPGETYNIASGKALSFRDAVKILADRLGCDATLTPDPARAGGARFSVGDSTKLKQATGWTPRIPLERTLAEMVNAQED
jgi:GDP-4-dehydro-6-deoxy-D-mannose reductase